MKRLIYAFTLFGIFSVAYGQVQTPQPSPSTEIKQVVGLTDVTIEYARPATRGRAIFGDLVPYDQIWRTGANANTKITFSDDVKIGDDLLQSGSYAIYTRPSKDTWQIYFYTKTDNWGLPNEWDENLVAATFITQVKHSDIKVENFTIEIRNLHNDGADLALAWDDVYVKIPFEVPTKQKALTSIENTLSANPSGNDYYAAASYYQQESKDLEKALGWINKAIEENSERYWYHRPRALVLADLGRYDEAIEAAQASLKLAETAGNTDYVRLNEKSIVKWTKKLENQ